MFEIQTSQVKHPNWYGRELASNNCANSLQVLDLISGKPIKNLRRACSISTISGITQYWNRIKNDPISFEIIEGFSPKQAMFWGCSKSKVRMIIFRFAKKQKDMLVRGMRTKVLRALSWCSNSI